MKLRRDLNFIKVKMKMLYITLCFINTLKYYQLINEFFDSKINRKIFQHTSTNPK